MKHIQIGHERFCSTYETLKKACYWKDITIDIRRYIQNCATYQIGKKKKKKKINKKSKKKKKKKIKKKLYKKWRIIIKN